MENVEKSGQKFKKLVQIMDSLREEKGCPWDRKQDERSIASYFLEEAYELIDAVFKNNTAAVEEELGDVIMEVVFLAKIFTEKGKFNISDVLAGINRKMIRRHPHVFGTDRVDCSEKVGEAWTKQKHAEKPQDFLQDAVMTTSPSLQVAFQIGQRASAYGFDWKNVSGVLQKLKEEILELEKAIEKKSHEDVLEEIGDILFTMANVSRQLNVNPEIALRFANEKFLLRFRYIEKKLKEKGQKISKATFAEMDELWDESKKVFEKERQ